MTDGTTFVLWLCILICFCACSFLSIQATKQEKRADLLQARCDSLERLKMDSTAIWVENGTLEQLEAELQMYYEDTLYQRMRMDTPFRIACKKLWNEYRKN